MPKSEEDRWFRYWPTVEKKWKRKATECVHEIFIQQPLIAIGGRDGLNWTRGWVRWKWHENPSPIGNDGQWLISQGRSRMRLTEKKVEETQHSLGICLMDRKKQTMTTTQSCLMDDVRVLSLDWTEELLNWLGLWLSPRKSDRPFCGSTDGWGGGH